jgi:hypothetical protein
MGRAKGAATTRKSQVGSYRPPGINLKKVLRYGPRKFTISNMEIDKIKKADIRSVDLLHILYSGNDLRRWGDAATD